MSQENLEKLLVFLRRLDQAKLHYSLDHYRKDAVSVLIAIPGERWEVDFLNDGDVEVERFTSDGEIADASALDELFVDEDRTDSAAQTVGHEDGATRG